MKKLGMGVFIVGLALCLCFVLGALQQSNEVATAYLRLHIRANSNSEQDQEVKYKVKRAVVDYLTPIVCDCKTTDDAKKVLTKELANINFIATTCLIENGFYYGANTRINNEFFPTRAYNGVTLNEGFYDALIIELGSGTGNNWWCVVYPPLCFIGAENTGENGIKYKSKIVEILKLSNIFC